jgi:hypothetical protein
MKNAIKIMTLGPIAALTLAGAALTQAGTEEALEGCKQNIYGDERMAVYETVSAHTDNIRLRGRYTNITLKVTGKSDAGVEETWEANCKATGAGKVASLELSPVDGPAQLAAQ